VATKTTALAVAASAVLTMVLAFAAGLTLAAPSARAQATGSDCAWAMQIGAGGINGYGADLDAGYWLTTFIAAPGAGVQIAGTYPQARYMSIDAYNPASPGYDAHLYDAQITPGAGVNPFQSPNSDSSGSASGTYTVNIEAVGGTAGTTGNTLYIPANGQLVTVMYRVYASDDPSDPTGGAGLPQISTTFFGTVTSTNPGCVAPPTSSSPVLLGELSADELSATQTPTSIEPTWTPRSVTHLPDPDSGYLVTQVNQTPGQTVVIRATMPTFPDTEAGQEPWSPAQARYWSLCEYVNLTLVASDCIPDSQAVLSGSDVGTFVVSTPADRPTNATAADGVNWMPWASSSVAVLVYRQIQTPPEQSFSQSISASTGAPDLESAMGQYFPQIVYCSTQVFEASGADGCFNAAGSSTGTGGSGAGSSTGTGGSGAGASTGTGSSGAGASTGTGSSGAGHSASVGPSSSPGRSQSEIKSSLGAQIAPTGKAARIRALLAARGYTFRRYRLPETGSIRLKWFYAHGAHRQKTLVASGQLSLGTRLTGKLHVVLTAAGRSALAHAGHIQLTGSAHFAAAGQAAITAARAFTLQR